MMTWVKKGLLIFAWLFVAAFASFAAQSALQFMGINHRGLVSFATQSPFTFVAVSPLVWVWWHAWRRFTA